MASTNIQQLNRRCQYALNGSGDTAYKDFLVSYTPSLMPNHNPDFDYEPLMHEQFLESNVLTIGALAWTGYLSKSRGALVVYRAEESEDLPEEVFEVKIGYLSREETVQNYPEGTELHQFVDEYDPQNGMVITFADIEASLVDSYRLTLTIPPPECYALLHEQMLESDIPGGDE